MIFLLMESCFFLTCFLIGDLAPRIIKKIYSVNMQKFFCLMHYVSGQH